LRIGRKNLEAAWQSMPSEFDSGIGERNVALEDIVKLTRALSVSPRKLFADFQKIVPRAVALFQHPAMLRLNFEPVESVR
jgi:hypothetical protein